MAELCFLVRENLCDGTSYFGVIAKGWEIVQICYPSASLVLPRVTESTFLRRG